MNNILQTYIPKFVVDLNRNNPDSFIVSTSYFSPEGDQFILDRRAVSPSVVITTQSLQDLQPEVSNTYPFKIVPPKEPDGSTLLLSPSVETEITASQNYYTPIYFERYDIDVLRALDRSFKELQLDTANTLS